MVKIYLPEYISELEEEYIKIDRYLENNESFVLKGKPRSGKTTIIKLYLKKYSIIEFSDYTISKEEFIIQFEKLSKNIISFFYNKKSIILIDNFDLFNIKIKELFLKINTQKIIITTNNTLLSKYNVIYIKENSENYLNNIFLNTYFLNYNKNYDNEVNIKSLDDIENNFLYICNSCNPSNSSSSNSSNSLNLSYLLFYNYSFNDLIGKTFEERLLIYEKYDQFSLFQYSIITGFDDIDSYSDVVNYISESVFYEKMEYYSFINFCLLPGKINNKIKNISLDIKKNKKKLYYNK